MTPRQSHGRIQRTITGQRAPRGPVETHERNVLAITRRIHTLERKRRDLRAALDEVATELRFKRRELRAALQRDASIVADDARLAVAGAADAIDGAEHHRERAK